jgi:type IV pilus assembly protein PilA
MLARIRKSMDEKDQGFTLIELLVVMIIIGILAAIAIPIFLNQRKKAVDSSIKSDLKNVASALEDYQVDNPNYTFAAGNITASVVSGSVKLSNGNVVVIVMPATPTAGTYCLKGSNPASNAIGGTGNFFYYSSNGGGLLPGAPVAAGPAGSGVCATL